MSNADPTITCDQAIFTSVRTPTGEGYRIIAASPGVKACEKREITRNAPSHGALCRPAEKTAAATDVRALDVKSRASATATAPTAIAFYALSEERLCVSLSLPAGAEHTGRGGARVYTHAVLFAADALRQCGYNPFAVARAMVEAGLTEPQLKPPPKLPELILAIPASHSAWRADPGSISQDIGVAVLEQLFEQRRIVVHTDGNWLESAEALWLSLPGPFRARLSMSAGLKFASTRSYHLQLITDEAGIARTRLAGTPVVYVDATAPESQDACGEDTTHAWGVFVRRHWLQGDWDGLAQRTSLPFTDVSPAGRQRVGRLFNMLDELPAYDATQLLNTATEHLDGRPSCPVEQTLVDDLLGAARHGLLARIAENAVPDAELFWKEIVRLWRRGERAATFAAPLVVAFLRSCSATDPLAAAEAALEVTPLHPAETTGDESLHAVIVEVLSRWAETVERIVRTGAGEEANAMRTWDRSRVLLERWRRLRPDCDIVRRIRTCCEASPVEQATR